MKHGLWTTLGQLTDGSPHTFPRAAQKLSLASKRKKPHPPPSPATRGAPTYPSDFSGVLQLWPPPVPPCLLRAAVKAKGKDSPGSAGKVGPALVWV